MQDLTSLTTNALRDLYAASIGHATKTRNRQAMIARLSRVNGSAAEPAPELPPGGETKPDVPRAEPEPAAKPRAKRQPPADLPRARDGESAHRYAQRLTDDGKTLREVCKAMQAAGYTTPRSNHKRWWPSSVQSLLKVE